MAIRLDKGVKGASFSDHYKLELFKLWYNLGKPSATMFQKSITVNDPIVGGVPSVQVINNWIKNEWSLAASDLDNQVVEQLENQMIADKVEMLQRHASIAKRMQTKAIEYLEENGVGSSRNAIELLVKGLEIERDSVGAPVIASKIANMSDEDLFRSLKELVAGSPIQYDNIQYENSVEVEMDDNKSYTESKE